MNDMTLCGERDSVAKLELLVRLDQFATLATRSNCLPVAAFSREDHARHVCHVEKMDELVNRPFHQESRGINSCMQWLSIVLDEGHIEPSQPCVGRVTGWPQRRISINSLWIDFTCWCLKQEIQKCEIPEQSTFFKLLDQVLLRNKDKYEFPSLEVCRKTFVTIRREYECN
jgi:hypothetical protein